MFFCIIQSISQFEQMMMIAVSQVVIQEPYLIVTLFLSLFRVFSTFFSFILNVISSNSFDFESASTCN